ncbi:MAG: hypothetical protein H7203_11500 [Rhizobacter sp.]|nr:hypothetical protein [Burkholderiales bacterium]
MTTTVKLPTTLEMTLRQHCAVSGESISDVIRVALEAHLSAAAENTTASPWSLGVGYFGRFAGPADLADTYREARGSVWDEVAQGKSNRRTPRSR